MPLELDKTGMDYLFSPAYVDQIPYINQFVSYSPTILTSTLVLTSAFVNVPSSQSNIPTTNCINSAPRKVVPSLPVLENNKSYYFDRKIFVIDPINVSKIEIIDSRGRTVLINSSKVSEHFDVVVTTGLYLAIIYRNNGKSETVKFYAQ